MMMVQGKEEPKQKVSEAQLSFIFKYYVKY